MICVHHPRDPSISLTFTTPRLAELERSFIDGALGRGEGRHRVWLDRRCGPRRHSYLGSDQREMVLRLTGGGERVVPVAAWPGTGKTTALAAAREAWEAAGHSVIGLATARTASGELSDAGVPATSMRRLLHRAEEWRAEGAPLANGTVVVVMRRARPRLPSSRPCAWSQIARASSS